MVYYSLHLASSTRTPCVARSGWSKYPELKGALDFSGGEGDGKSLPPPGASVCAVSCPGLTLANHVGKKRVETSGERFRRRFFPQLACVLASDEDFW